MKTAGSRKKDFAKGFTLKRRSMCAVFIIAAVISCTATVYWMRPDNIADIACSQVGNTGGKKYWQWYGFERHVDWCACFVSWCIYKSGAQEPKFSMCDDGIRWFIDNDKWQNKDIKPEPGMIIFFDRDGDGASDHTAVVRKYEDDRVYTIEGNMDDKCAEGAYDSDDETIAGYGII